MNYCNRQLLLPSEDDELTVYDIILRTIICSWYIITVHIVRVKRIVSINAVVF